MINFQHMKIHIQYLCLCFTRKKGCLCACAGGNRTCRKRRGFPYKVFAKKIGKLFACTSLKLLNSISISKYQ